MSSVCELRCRVGNTDHPVCLVLEAGVLVNVVVIEVGGRGENAQVLARLVLDQLNVKVFSKNLVLEINVFSKNVVLEIHWIMLRA